MRHRLRGRYLGRTSSHRRALFRNLARSLILSVRVDEKGPNPPKVAGRIITTLAKAKELRPFIERLVTMARKANVYEQKARQFETTASRNSDAWRRWRESNEWNRWNQVIAPAVAFRRRAFALLRDRAAVDILFDELAKRFLDRPGGYTRVVRVAAVRLGDAGQQALIEFVGEHDRTRQRREAPIVTDEEQPRGQAEPDALDVQPAGSASESHEATAGVEAVDESARHETDSTEEAAAEAAHRAKDV